MLYSMKIYEDRTRKNQLDFFEVFSTDYFKNNTIVRLDDSLEFNRAADINDMVMYILLQTSICFDIKNL